MCTRPIFTNPSALREKPSAQSHDLAVPQTHERCEPHKVAQFAMHMDGGLIWLSTNQVLPKLDTITCREFEGRTISFSYPFCWPTSTQPCCLAEEILPTGPAPVSLLIGKHRVLFKY